jgi:predicted RND superfamily exporter protein
VAEGNGLKAPEAATLRFARWTVGNRFWVSMFLIVATLFFLYPTVNALSAASGMRLPGPIVRVDASERAQWPDHPFIHAQDKFSTTFGSSSLVAIAIVANKGTVLTPEGIEKISRITNRLDGEGYDSRTEQREELREKIEDALPEDEELDTFELLKQLDQVYPPYPVNHDRIQSLTHGSTRVVTIEPDGAITTDVLIKKKPKTQEDADAIREVVRQNPPFIFGRLVSRDEKGAFISADFISNRLTSREVYMAVFDHVKKIREGWRCTEVEIEAGRECSLGDWIWEPEDDRVRLAEGLIESEDDIAFEVFVSGSPIGTGWIITHAFEIGRFVALTVLLTFTLLLVYFRRLHGVLIPFIAALATFIWGMGFTGWMSITFDPLVLVIPMIITGRAVSHTVQMAERFFEDYEVIMGQGDMDPETAKVEAATIAMGELIVPGTLGIVTDFLGLLVILITTIPQMHDLGIFGAFWVLTILFTVEILHPVMICYLPAPHDAEHHLPGFMIRVMRAIGNFVTHQVGKYVVAGVALVLLVVSSYIAVTRSTIGEATPGTPLLWPDHEFNLATAKIAEKFGGVDSFVVYADGDRENATADPEPIRAMEEFERWMYANTDLGFPFSIVPIIRGYWSQNHYGDPKWYFVPDHPGTVRNVLFQLKTNGPPGFLRPFATDDNRKANIAFFYPDHKGSTITRAVMAASMFIKENPIGEVNIRLDKDHAGPDDSWFSYDSLVDMLYYMIGPMIPQPRNHTLDIALRQKDGSYIQPEVHSGSNGGPPPWLDEFAAGAMEDFEDARDSVDEGEYFTWPDTLESWDASDVDAWWEDEQLGIRAVSINTKDLIVHDLKAVDSVPSYQPTNSWTRGVQFVLAGGVMGVLAAVNDEVERGHVANISLILLVIYVLQALTYRSLWSGTIIVVQLATATMLSLAYMAIKGVGLNINTLPVQSVGVGIGVDYAIYIVDRIRQEVVETEGDIDEAVRRTISTTGMAVSFTATTIVGGIVTWMWSNLRFQAEMAQLLVILMVINMLGAITIVPAFYSIIKPKFAQALLDEKREAEAKARVG